jgi:hypothetical protein
MSPEASGRSNDFNERQHFPPKADLPEADNERPRRVSTFNDF